MQITRREFTGHLVGTAALAATAGGSAIFLGGCNVFNDISNWIPVGEAALNSILNVLTANGIIIAPGVQTIVGLIEAGFTALTAAIKEYQSTTPAPVGALAKIEAAFNAITDNFTTFLKSLSVSNTLVATIVGLAQVVLSTIAAFMTQLPASTSALRTAIINRSITVNGTTSPVSPKLRTRRVFKKNWNSILDAGVKQGVIIPKAAYLPLSFFEHL